MKRIVMCLHTTNVVVANVVVAGVVAAVGVAALLAVHAVERLFGLLAGRIVGSHRDVPLCHTAAEQLFVEPVVEPVFVLFGQLVVVRIAFANDAFALADAVAAVVALSVAASVLSVVVPAESFEQMLKQEH